MAAEELVILGIDPGTTIMGFGIIKVQNGNMSFIQMNELILTKVSTHTLNCKRYLNAQ